ncbi:MAG: ChbG/HpnK family deacetylase, partial [Elusimicrobia bacterium]|nr:ChbG/HpnK family deacetylase [Elusimicrobiota bacterium]
MPAPEASASRLVVNADDLGISPAVTKGILEAHEAGILKSASLMANAPGFEDAVRRLRSCPTLGVGLHFNLTAGRPLSAQTPEGGLVDRSGRFHPLGRFILRCAAGRVKAEAIERELRAQLG